MEMQQAPMNEEDELLDDILNFLPIESIEPETTGTHPRFDGPQTPGMFNDLSLDWTFCAKTPWNLVDPKPADTHSRLKAPPTSSGDSSNKQRRRVQNREAQRAFRERKDTQIKELSEKVERLENEAREAQQRYTLLYTKHLRLLGGLKALVQTHGLINTISLTPASMAEV